MKNTYFQNTKYVSITILISALATFAVPQAFAGGPSIDIPVNIDFMKVNDEPDFSISSIHVFCADPVVTDASITGNLLEIDDSPLFDSVDVSTSGLICDGSEDNVISTAFLTDLTSYYVRLTVFTDLAGPSIDVYDETFVQPDSAILVLDDVDADAIYTIKFRDIGVTDNIGPNIAFGTKPSTLTVTDHNANIDLLTAEKITVKINDIDTVLDETGANTGMFTGPITGGASVFYEPGVLGVARATIVIDFDVVPGDPDGKGDIIIEDLQLTDEQILFGFDGLTPVNHPVRIAFADGGKVTDGEHIDVTISYADADLREAAADIGSSLTGFAADEMFDDNSFGCGMFCVDETIYKDVDGDGFVSIGDVRLANAATGGFGYVDGSVVAPGDFDVDLALSPFAVELYDDADGSGSFGVGETVYNDVDFDGFVSIGDVRLANAATGGFGYVDDSVVAPADDPLLLQMYYQSPGSGYNLITASFDDGSHDTDAKTVVSNPTLDIDFGPVLPCVPGCYIVEGNYVLGFEAGVGGGGAGGISKAGFVVNALGGLGGLSSSTSNSPPSFGTSSFATITGGEEGFGGIINDNDVNTLEETKTFQVGEKAVLRFDFTEGGGIGQIEHIGLYANVRDGQKRQDSDVYIYYDPLKSPQLTVHDPNGLLSEANFELLQKDVTHFVLKYDLTFAKPMAKSDLILESWNIKKWSTINKIPSAIEVLSSGILQDTASEQSEPVETFLEDVTDDQVIPVWVKSNAKWWSDGTIDNETFISGLEYLVNEGVIKVSLQETNTAISEVQPWIKNTAGWWADGMISEDEFVTAIEWLITNNIIEVAA